MQDPLSVACPTCLAKIGEKCRKPSGFTKPHASRIAAELAASEAEANLVAPAAPAAPAADPHKLTVVRYSHTRHILESIDGKTRVVSPSGITGPWTEGKPCLAWKAYKTMRKAQAQALPHVA